MALPDEDTPWFAKLWRRRLRGPLHGASWIIAACWVGAASSFVLKPPTPRPGAFSLFEPLWVWQSVFVMAACLMVAAHILNRLYIVAYVWCGAALLSLTITLLFASAITATGWLTPSLTAGFAACHFYIALLALPPMLGVGGDEK